MNPLKEEKKAGLTKAIRTLFICSSVIASFMGMIGMSQMIGPVYAQSTQGSEHACKELPGATLERGQCIAPADSELVCDPSSVGGVTAIPNDETQTCTATTTFTGKTAQNDAKQFAAQCDKIEDSTSTITPVTGSNDKKATCTFPATEEFTCPGDIIPTTDGLCITKPGNRSEEEV